MKYWIIGFVVVGLVVAGFIAGSKHGENKAKDSTVPEPSTSALKTVLPSAIVSSIATTGATVVGNRQGNRAPDFRLKDLEGKDVSLRDYIGREEVKIVFTVSEQVTLQGRTLLDPSDIVHRLYAVTSMPYTVNIDSNGIIK